MSDDNKNSYDDDPDSDLPDADSQDFADDSSFDPLTEVPDDYTFNPTDEDIEAYNVALPPVADDSQVPQDSEAANRNDWFIVKVIYGAFNNSGLFVSRGLISPAQIESNMSIVVKTERGVEIGRTEGKAKALPRNSRFAGAGVVQRISTPKDIDRDRLLREETGGKEWKLCLNLIVKHKLKMELVFIEHLLGGERIIFHFKSDNRIDFRALVRDLAFRLKTRIELHQVGGRDEARLLGEFGHCGQPLCCKRFLSKIPSVSMRSASAQLPSINTQRVSGVCNHLRCCLKYEESGYRELQKLLPAIGSDIAYKTADNKSGEGRVIDHGIISLSVRVQPRNSDDAPLLVKLEEIVNDLTAPSDSKPAAKTSNVIRSDPRNPDEPGLNDRRDESRSNDRRDVSGSNDRRDVSGSNDRRDESGSNDRRDMSGPIDRRDVSGSNDRRDKSRSNDRRDASRSNDRRDKSRPNDRRDKSRPNDRRDKPRSNDRRDESGSNDRRDESGPNERRDVSGSNDRRDVPGPNDRRDESGSNDKRDESGSNDKRDESGRS